MDNTMTFAVDSIEFVDNVQDALFRKMRIKAFASGQNAHTLPIEEDVLRRGALTVYNKPILWKYNPFTDDANTHDIDEVPCGFVPDTEDNKVVFEKEPDGRLFMIINALIWTKYCGRLLEIFQRDGYKKSVSIELVINSDSNNFEKPRVLDFVIAGITILGEWIDPACKGSEAELLKFSMEDFSADKEKYMDSLGFAEKKTIKINNSKESAVSGAWSNPRRRLFTPIIEANNKNSLLKEAYLVYGDNNNPVMSKYKYPHHIIKDGELVLHINGLQSAFSRASQQGIVDGEVRKHLLRHYRELGLSQENFADFGLTEKDFAYFSNIIDGLESVGEKQMAEGIKDSTMIEGENPETEITESVVEENKETVVQNSEEEKEENVVEEENLTEEQMAEKIAEMTETIKQLTADNEAYMAKIEAMADYEELKQYKADMIEKEAREKEMAEMEKVMACVEEKGVVMSADDKEKLMSEIVNFSSIDAWSNYVKAYVFDKSENFDGIVRIANTDTQQVKSNSIWDNLNI